MYELPAQPYDTAGLGVGIQRIVVGVDGSEPGWQALSWAVEEARSWHACLVVCQARAEPLPGGEYPPIESIELLDPPLARQIHAIRDRLGGHRVELTLRGADAVAALLDPRHHADLVVVSSGTRGRLTQRWLGSVALRLTAGATCPVVVVRAIAGHGDAPFSGHVVVGVDDAQSARSALRFGFAYAARHRVPLAAVHVTAGWPGDLWYDERMLETHFVAEPPSLGMLASAVEPLERHYPEVSVKRAVYGGRTVDGLRHASVGARLLVVGRRVRGMSSVLNVGPVSEHLVDNAPCPVAVVPLTRQQPHEGEAPR